MKRKIDFALLFEHSVREIESLCLIKCELEMRGYSAEIIYKHDILERNKYIPSVVVTPFLYNTLTMQRVSKYGNHIADRYLNLQWEQIFCVNDTKEVEFHLPKGVTPNAAHISWGGVNRKRLEDFGVKKNNIFETGHVAMDLCNERFMGIYKSRESLCNEYGLDINKKWILFISSFAEVDPRCVKELEINFGLDETRIKRIGITINSQKEILKWFSELLKTNDDIQIIYRPHPSEGNNICLENMEKELSDFKVIREGSGRQWMLRSDYVCTWISTSIVEAYYMKKKCAILRPIELPKELENEIMENGRYITNYEEFCTLNEETFSINEGLIEKHYGKSGDGRSFIRVCDACEKVFKDSQYIVEVPSRKTFWAKDILRFMRDVIIHNCDKKKISPLLFGSAKQLFEMHEHNMYGYRDMIFDLSKKYRSILSKK